MALKTGPDTSISTYRSKRDFAVTSEPAPGDTGADTETRMFVVQKHHAHRAGLHWDFRLEHAGVLWSWAVPKGPSLDPADRRLAIHVEDHPIDYAEFQGTIPAGQYGGGAVETWDRGTWEPLGDPGRHAQGHLRFVLHGQRLNGRFTLVRLNRRDPRKQEAWFLIKGHDEAAREGVDATALEQRSRFRPRPKRRPPAGEQDSPPAPGAVRGALPQSRRRSSAPIARSRPRATTGSARSSSTATGCIASVDQGTVRLLTRNGHDWADRLPSCGEGDRRTGRRRRRCWMASWWHCVRTAFPASPTCRPRCRPVVMTG